MELAVTLGSIARTDDASRLTNMRGRLTSIHVERLLWWILSGKYSQERYTFLVAAIFHQLIVYSYHIRHVNKAARRNYAHYLQHIQPLPRGSVLQEACWPAEAGITFTDDPLCTDYIPLFSEHKSIKYPMRYYDSDTHKHYTAINAPLTKDFNRLLTSNDFKVFNL